MERRLAAILAADVIGYSRLMGADEAGTLERLTELRQQVLEPLIGQHNGRIVKLMGDALLVEFGSVVDAVSCAVAWQNEVAQREAAADESNRLNFRIGINLGDVIVGADDIHGDGVNIASRLEALAKPGGVSVSGTVFDHVKGKVDVEFEDIGEQYLKNIADPVRVYRVAGDVPNARLTSGSAEALPLPNKPSIAVLPFTNMSGDPDQEYFADGMVEEIITALSRMRWLFVIARSSSFTYKGRAVDVKQVGRELGVRYLLEGSVRKAGSRVRISGQLVDTETGAHLWADRFDGALEDVFDLQDQVTASVVGAIAPELEQAEIERAKRKPTESLVAYDYYLRGMALIHQWKRETNKEALSLFYQAIELDPNFAPAYGMAARCFNISKASGWMVDPERDAAEAIRLARRAAELGTSDALALCTAGIGLAFVAGELDDGAALIDRALALNPNLAWAWLFSGWVKVWLGEPEVAIEHVRHAMRLSPHDPQVFGMHSAIAFAHFFAGRYAEALSWAQAAMRERPDTILATCITAASAALAGELTEAEKAMVRTLQLDPELRTSNLKNLYPIRRSEDFAKWEDGLLKAGLPI